MRGTYQLWKCKRRGGCRDKELPELLRVAGGFNAWNDAHSTEWAPWAGYDEAENHASGSSDATHALGDCWRAILEPRTNTITYEHLQSGRQSKVRPPGARVLVEQLVGTSAVPSAPHPLATS